MRAFSTMSTPVDAARGFERCDTVGLLPGVTQGPTRGVVGVFEVAADRAGGEQRWTISSGLKP